MESNGLEEGRRGLSGRRSTLWASCRQAVALEQNDARAGGVACAAPRLFCEHGRGGHHSVCAHVNRFVFCTLTLALPRGNLPGRAESLRLVAGHTYVGW